MPGSAMNCTQLRWISDAWPPQCPSSPSESTTLLKALTWAPVYTPSVVSVPGVVWQVSSVTIARCDSLYTEYQTEPPLAKTVFGSPVSNVDSASVPLTVFAVCANDRTSNTALLIATLKVSFGGGAADAAVTPTTGVTSTLVTQSRRFQRLWTSWTTSSTPCGSRSGDRLRIPERLSSAATLARFGEVLAAELQEAAHALLLALDALGEATRVLGRALGEVLEAELRIVGQRVHVRDVLLGARDPERRAALGERSRAADGRDGQALLRRDEGDRHQPVRRQ